MNRLYFLAVVFAATIILVTQLFMAYVGENGGISTFETLVTGLLFVVHTYCFIERLQNYGSMMMRISGVAKVSGEGGGVQPHFCSWEKCVFSHFSRGKMGKKSVWKERETNTLPIYFFPFFPMEKGGKNGKRHIFPMDNNGVGPPSVYHPGWTDPRRLPA